MGHHLRGLLLVLSLAVGLPAILAGQGTEPGKKAQDTRNETALPLGAIARMGMPQTHQVTNSPLIFLADGQTLVTTQVNRPKTGKINWKESYIIFWEAKTGKELRRLDGHAFVEFSPDGKLVASQATPNNKSIRIFDLITGKEKSQVSTEITDHGSTWLSRAFCLSADGKFIAVGGGSENSLADDPPLWLWEVSSGKKVRSFPTREMLGSLTFSCDGKTLATANYLGGIDGPIQLWDVATAKKLRDLNLDGIDNHFHSTTMRFSPDDNTLVSVGNFPAAVCLWDVQTGKQRWRIQNLDNTTGHSVAFSPSGRMLAVGNSPSSVGTIYLIETATGQVRGCFKGRRGNVPSVVFSRDGLLLASSGGDGVSNVWDVTGRILAVAKSSRLSQIRNWTPPGQTLAGDDPAKAWKAILALAARPEQAVPLLKQRLPANQPLDPKRLTKLLADLESNDFDTRNKLARTWRRWVMSRRGLRKLLAGESSVDLRVQVEKLLSKVGKDGILTEEVRCLRALEVLEYAATPDAKKLLAAEAKGARLAIDAGSQGRTGTPRQTAAEVSCPPTSLVHQLQRPPRLPAIVRRGSPRDTACRVRPGPGPLPRSSGESRRRSTPAANRSRRRGRSSRGPPCRRGRRRRSSARPGPSGCRASPSTP